MFNPTSVTKEVTFDCAHMLSGHEALCKNLHGHTYKVQVTVTGYPIVEKGSSASMVIDFQHLKKAIDEVIISKFDHAVIFSAEAFRGQAEEELLFWARSYKLRHFVMPVRSTAEQMALYFSEAISEYLKNEAGLDNIQSCACRVFETPTSCAEVVCK